MNRVIAFISALAVALLCAAAPALAQSSYGLSLYGELKYPPDFKHFDYVNPNAPKGGSIKYAAIGTFDSFNPFILKGVAAQGVGLMFDTLMAHSDDEPASSYGLVAESVDVAPDKRSVIFNLRPQAKFWDGTPITAADVVWTFDTLKSKGNPYYRLYYTDVIKAEALDSHRVKFIFRAGTNRELPSIVGDLPVLSKAYWSTHDFGKTTLTVPLGSGPYKIVAFGAGRYVVYRRVADYWAKNLPVNVGRYNFDKIRYDYYRDQSVALEAFKAGAYDIRIENVAKNWAIGYNGPALSAGWIKKAEIPNKVPQGMQAFGFNLRRKLFQDRRAREALGYLFNFEWTNKTLFYGAYKRTESYFANSDLASSGPPGPDELKILDKYRGEIPDSVFTRVFKAPTTDGTGDIRANLHAALKLLAEAGWTVKNGRMVNAQGQPFRFEFLLDQPEFERVVLPFARNLARIGIVCNVRTVDPAQYQNRMNNFDFDMTVVLFPEGPSPGNEQRDYWTSASADQIGGGNLLGIKSKAVDDLVNLVIDAPNRQSLVTRTHALDRVLLGGYYVVPNWYLPYFRVAYWDKFGRPSINPPYALALNAWWYDKARADALAAQRK
ncbi:MAG: ABC transporter substrate-binding protein [Alphaproteobacteria bacterium]|nr:ABC transporter substrate-binding protein [Alphaproteobacteria bacterium]